MELIHALQSNTPLFYSTIVILGLLVGSFLNVVILRLPVMLKNNWRHDCQQFLAEHFTADLVAPPEAISTSQEKFNLVTPRSRCPQCGHMITAAENIPVISYLFLGGKCRACKTPISIRYPIIEILSALLAVSVAWSFGVSWQTLFALLLVWSLLALTFIDYDHQYLPDQITLPLLWLGLLVNTEGLFIDLHSAVIGAAAGYLVLWLVYQVFKLVTGKEGMGFGDFKLLAMLGAWLGWQMLPAIILISSVIGALVGILLILLKRHDKGKPIPFGPYLAGAGWVALLWGKDLNTLYFNLMLGTNY